MAPQIPKKRRSASASAAAAEPEPEAEYAMEVVYGSTFPAEKMLELLKEGKLEVVKEDMYLGAASGKDSEGNQFKRCWAVYTKEQEPIGMIL